MFKEGIPLAAFEVGDMSGEVARLKARLIQLYQPL
jgi:hypothetical protein